MGERAMFLPYNSKSYNDSRTLVFGLTYRFGKQSVKLKEVSKDDKLQQIRDCNSNPFLF